MKPSFDSLMNAVIAQLELASSVAAATTDGAQISHGKASAVAPPRVATPHLHYRRVYASCHSDARRRALVIEALDELRSVRYSRKPNVDRETKEGRLIIGRDPRPARIIAYVYGYSERHVHRLRAEARAHDARSVRQRANLTLGSVLDVRREAA